jgi:hypothetical protein
LLPRAGSLRAAALAPRTQLQAVQRGAELVARAVSTPDGTEKAPRSYELNKAKPARAGGDDKPRKPKREVTVQFGDIAVGKSFKGTVVRAAARRRAGSNPSLALRVRNARPCRWRRAARAPSHALPAARRAPRSRAWPRTARSSTSAPPRTAWRTSRSCRCARVAVACAAPRSRVAARAVHTRAWRAARTRLAAARRYCRNVCRGRPYPVAVRHGCMLSARAR